MCYRVDAMKIQVRPLIHIERLERDFRRDAVWGIWMAQSVKGLTHDFSPGHDLNVVRSSTPCQTLRWAWNLLGILSPSPFAPTSLACALALSLKINKSLKKNTFRKLVGITLSLYPNWGRIYQCQLLDFPVHGRVAVFFLLFQKKMSFC